MTDTIEPTLSASEAISALRTAIAPFKPLLNMERLFAAAVDAERALIDGAVLRKDADDQLAQINKDLALALSRLNVAKFSATQVVEVATAEAAKVRAEADAYAAKLRGEAEDDRKAAADLFATEKTLVDGEIDAAKRAAAKDLALVQAQIAAAQDTLDKVTVQTDVMRQAAAALLGH